MWQKGLIALLTCTVALSTSLSLADAKHDFDNGKGKGNSGHHWKDKGNRNDWDDDHRRWHQHNDVNINVSVNRGRLSDTLRDVLNGRDRYSISRAALLRQQELPPGIAKNLHRGKPLPPGIAKKMYYLPNNAYGYWGIDNRRYRAGMYGDNVILTSLATGLIVDILSNVL